MVNSIAQVFDILIDFVFVPSVTEGGMFKFPTIMWICLFFSIVNFYFIYFEALVLYSCAFIIVMSSQISDLLINI